MHINVNESLYIHFQRRYGQMLLCMQACACNTSTIFCPLTTNTPHWLLSTPVKIIIYLPVQAKLVVWRNLIAMHPASNHISIMVALGGPPTNHKPQFMPLYPCRHGNNAFVYKHRVRTAGMFNRYPMQSVTQKPQTHST